MAAPPIAPSGSGRVHQPAAGVGQPRGRAPRPVPSGGDPSRRRGPQARGPDPDGAIGGAAM